MPKRKFRYELYLPLELFWRLLIACWSEIVRIIRKRLESAEPRYKTFFCWTAVPFASCFYLAVDYSRQFQRSKYVFQNSSQLADGCEYCSAENQTKNWMLQYFCAHTKNENWIRHVLWNISCFLSRETGLLPQEFGFRDPIAETAHESVLTGRGKLKLDGQVDSSQCHIQWLLRICGRNAYHSHVSHFTTSKQVAAKFRQTPTKYTYNKTIVRQCSVFASHCIMRFIFFATVSYIYAMFPSCADERYRNEIFGTARADTLLYFADHRQTNHFSIDFGRQRTLIYRSFGNLCDSKYSI